MLHDGIAERHDHEAFERSDSDDAHAGIVTDIGIALGRIVFARSGGSQEDTSSEIDALRLLASLIVLFFAGGVVGTVGFRHVGFLFTLPLSAMLLLLAMMPVLDDVRRRGLTTA